MRNRKQKNEPPGLTGGALGSWRYNKMCQQRREDQNKHRKEEKLERELEKKLDMELEMEMEREVEKKIITFPSLSKMNMAIPWNSYAIRSLKQLVI